MVPNNAVWIATVCLLMSPLLTSGKRLPKDIKTIFDYMHDKVYDNSNDVTVFSDSSGIKSMTQMQKQHLSGHVPAAQIKSTCVPQPQRRPSLSSDFYHIGDLKFSIPTRTVEGIRKRTILAECGFLVGLSDFKAVTSFDESKGSTDPHFDELWFRWNNLKAKCQISTVIDGLKDGTGEADVLVKPLYMLVRLPPSATSAATSEIEMTRAKEVTVTIQDLNNLPVESTQAISDEIDSRVMCIVNSEVRNILKDSLKSSLLKQSPLDISKLKGGYRTL